MKIQVKAKPANTQHETGCIICGEKLKYTESVKRECAVCHKMKESNAVCEAGHFVCDACHSLSIDGDIQAFLLSNQEKDPVKLFQLAVSLPSVHVHGPEHHGLVPGVLLTAYKNNGGSIDLENALFKAINRAKHITGGGCAYWGVCGAAAGAGIYISVVTGADPLNKDWWYAPQLVVSRCLAKNAEQGGVRCCKRTGYNAIIEAVSFTREKLGVEMPVEDFHCTHSGKNKECLGVKCPYFEKQ